MMQGIKDKTALVTGAGSGMGYEIAVALGSAGARVAAHYRKNRQGADRAVELITSQGGAAIAVQADLSVANEVQNVFDRIDQAFGPVGLLVNNAGDWMDKCNIVDCPQEQWDKMFDVNVKSMFLCCQQAARRMIDQGDGGAIVNIGSIAGHTGGGGGTVPYGAAKAAVHTFTRGLARELGAHGIRVNAVAPGLIETPMIDGRVTQDARARFAKMAILGRLGQPQEIAPIVLMLLSDGASYMTGEIVEVNGGLLTR